MSSCFAIFVQSTAQALYALDVHVACGRRFNFM